jgi:endonuclease G, mitochondrial
MTSGRIRAGARGAGPVVWAAILLAALFGAGAAFGQTDANDLQSCRALWAAIGVPVPDDDAGIETVPVCHTGYVLAHDSRTKTPDWVIEHVTREIADGTATRPGVKFRQEPNLPDTAPGAVDDDYKGSGFDRGHQAPSADFKSSADLMADTFFLSNVVPQVGKGFNQGIWRELEALVREVAIDRGELYVITGPVYQEKKTVAINPGEDACGADFALKPLEEKAIGASRVAVPAALYKIAFDPRLGRLNAYLLPNIDHRGLQGRSSDVEYLEKYRVGLGTIEALTGWQFFTAFDERTRGILEKGCAATMLH